MSTIAPKGDADQDLILALDAGGTMTDAILVKPDGTFTVGKSISRKDDQQKRISPKRCSRTIGDDRQW